MAVFTDNPALADRLLGRASPDAWQPPRVDVRLGAVLHEFLESPVRMRRRPAPDRWSHLLVAETAADSNFDRLIQLVRDGAPLPDRLACLAGSGHGFHGFKGRPWTAVPGNIHLSVHLAPRRPIERFEVAFMALAAISVVDAVDRVPGLDGRAGIRWVNDVVVDEAKLGGVLAYTHAQGTTVNAAILGVGVNVNTRPEVEPTPFVPSVTALREHLGGEPDRPGPLLPRFLAHLLDALDRNYRLLLERGTRPLVDRYRDRSVVVGRDVAVCHEDSDAEPRVLTRGVVQAIGDGLELLLEGRERPVTRGRIMVVDGQRGARS